MSNLHRIEQIVKAAENLPRIDAPPEDWNPTQEELVKGYFRLAAGYATATALLQQTIPLLVEEIRVVHDELSLRRKRSAKVLGIKR